jgi:phosphonate transport system ATP-binding protein
LNYSITEGASEAIAAGTSIAIDQPVIDCQNLTVGYDSSQSRPVLNTINSQINLGEFVAIMGLNGAGKSTWLRCLAGLVPIRQGRIQILGHDANPRSYGQIRQHLGAIMQGGGLIPQLSVIENVLCGCLGRYSSWQTLMGFPIKEQTKALQLLKQFGLADKANAVVKQLSGGQQQRVAIARALMQNATILLADEPTNGLDVMVAKQVMDTLVELNQKQGMTIMVVLHDLKMAATYAHRAIILDQGKIFYDGDTDCLAEKFAQLRAASCSLS